MFDFENTPITHYTKLRANYQCTAPSLLTYYGDWARITLVDGTELEVQSESELNSLLPATSTATVAGQSVSVSNIKKIEFGTKVTAIPNNSLNLLNFSSLAEVNGFHEGLKSIGTAFMVKESSTNFTPIIPSVLVFPSTINSIPSSTFYQWGVFTGTLVINTPVSVFPTSSNMFTSSYSNSPFYTQGVRVTGRYANDFLTKFPNLNGTSYYRNFYNGNTLSNFIEGLQDGSAQELMPPGTLIPSLYATSTPFSFRVLHYGTATLASDSSKAGGVYLMALVSVGAATTSNADYSASTLKVGVGEALPNFEQSIRDSVAEITIPYIYNNVSKPVNAKLWLQSATEVYGVPLSASGQEGEPFDFWKDNSSLSAPGNGNDTNRKQTIIKQGQTSGSVIGWALRSSASTNLSSGVNLNGAINTRNNTDGTYFAVPSLFIPGVIKLLVTFDPKGGSPTPAAQRVTFGSFATKPDPDPVLEGYKFAGWFLLGQVPDTIGEIPVMFRMNGGTPQEPTQYVKTGEYATAPTTEPTREGYDFLGWYKAGEVPDDWDGINVV